MQQTFAELIKTYRKKHNINQEEFAEFLGKSQSAVSSWEIGRSFPIASEIVMIARATGLNMHEISESIIYAKNKKNNIMNQVEVALDSNTSIQELQRRYHFTLDGEELTYEELKKALEIIELERFKKYKKQQA